MRLPTLILFGAVGFLMCSRLPAQTTTDALANVEPELVMVAEATLKAVVPTVFVLVRQSTLKHGRVDVEGILKAAARHLEPPAHFENIIVVEEGSTWSVSYHSLGNGRMVTPPGAQFAQGYLEGTPKTIVHLNKADLSVALPRADQLVEGRGPNEDG